MTADAPAQPSPLPPLEDLIEVLTLRDVGTAHIAVTDVQGIGDKAVQVSGSVGSKKTAESYYLFAVGTTPPC